MKEGKRCGVRDGVGGWKSEAGSGDRAQKMSRLFVRVKLFRDFYILKNI